MVILQTLVHKEWQFEAAHKLPNHGGKCADLHGHTYRLEIVVSGVVKQLDGAPDEGMVIDFYQIEEIVKPLIESTLDHKYLNDWENVPTAERLAARIFDYCFGNLALTAPNVTLESVRLWETSKCYAEVRAKRTVF